jgi:hypothetical protein
VLSAGCAAGWHDRSVTRIEDHDLLGDLHTAALVRLIRAGLPVGDAGGAPPGGLGRVVVMSISG